MNARLIAKKIIITATRHTLDPMLLLENFKMIAEVHGLQSLVPSVTKYVLAHYQALKNTQTLKINTSHPLEKESVNTLTSWIGIDKKVTTEILEDESLIGGVLMTYNHKQYDMSLKTGLRQLYQQLMLRS